MKFKRNRDLPLEPPLSPPSKTNIDKENCSHAGRAGSRERKPEEIFAPSAYLELLRVRGAPNGHPLRRRPVLGLHVFIQGGIPGKLGVLRVVVGLALAEREIKA